jgi:hypothetical protein
MKNSMQRFFEMLEQVPKVAQFWDKNKAVCRTELLDDNIGLLSLGEQYMVRFFAAVWFGNNTRYGFDVVCLASIVNPEWRQIIIDWLADPFYP